MLSFVSLVRGKISAVAATLLGQSHHFRDASILMMGLLATSTIHPFLYRRFLSPQECQKLSLLLKNDLYGEFLVTVQLTLALKTNPASIVIRCSREKIF